MRDKNVGLPFLIATLFALASFAGCNHSNSEPTAARSLSSSERSTSGSSLIRDRGYAVSSLSPPSLGDSEGFTLLSTADTGVSFINRVDAGHPLKRLYHSGFVCGGVSIGDVDGDEIPDLYLTSGPGRNRLYRQSAPLEFEDITDSARVSGGDSWGAGAAMADIDNDGDLDIYVCNYDSPNQLFLNNGRGRFREAADECNLDIVDASITPAFCDYDRDGDLDLYVLTNRLYRQGGRPSRPPYSVRDGRPYVLPEYQKYYVLKHQGGSKYSIDNTGRPDHLLRNNGDGTFTDVSIETGIVEAGHGLSITWWDYNHDKWPDAYIGNDFNDPDHLYRNNGDGTFTDVAESAIPHSSWFSMGADFADLNDDCRFDLLVADMSATSHYGRMTTMLVMNADKISRITARPPQVMKNALYINSGVERFYEAAELAGLADSDWTWAIKLADFDNDGRNDAYFSNGTVREFTHADRPMEAQQMIGRTEWDHYEDSPPKPQRNLAFRNLGDLRFENVSHAWGLDKVAMSYAAAYSDLDRDGDLDLVVANLDEPVSVYRNDLTCGARLVVALRGDGSNRQGIGATVSIETAAGRQIRMISPQTGFLSGNEAVAHFGLGKDEHVERLVVDWPSGRRQVIGGIQANQLVTVQEPPAAGSNAIDEGGKAETQEAEWFRPIAAPGGLEHEETAFDDFAAQPLLPRRLSQSGPSIAVADYDGDGDDDFYFGGAAGQPGRLAINDGQGRFRVATITALEADAACEDMGAVWFDIEGDGDLDLYVSSGGVESEAGGKAYADRLYVNDGGGLTPALPNAHPGLRDSASGVAAADFDHDGDVDLVVGARVIPGEYPKSPATRLLENRNGRLVDVTEEVAPELLSAGLVTSVIWSDADDDGWVDLLLTTEWGPVRLFKNSQGRLVESTDAAGLASLTGWWNGIAARDFDGDEDIDYVVTNCGLNSRYKATEQRPAVLYYGGFDGLGGKQLLEAEYEGDTLVPVRDMSSASRVMPHLRMMFDSHDRFATSSLEELYTAEALADAHKLTATTLASGVLVNDGSGGFAFRPLPRIAQVAPSFGVVVSEFNGDGVPDVYVVQNFAGAAAESGRMDGGISMMLTGNGDATFEAVSPSESGLVAPGDATAVVECSVGERTQAPLLLVGVNNGRLQAFEPAEEHGSVGEPNHHNLIRVKLEGPRGNPLGYGARVTLRSASGPIQTAELCAGSGYLSQSSSVLVFGNPHPTDDSELEVRWPDGSRSTHAMSPSPIQTLRYPGQ
ncbi:ASPIC and UnbV [Posidoniimonas polymericola]|uniref:ASPIC and UnbV n=1 Tax=Posidoniimonas polymericola TaxID=2528002 RepID=A0A5C5YBS6_9BACT|nr:FG-GAP-like repeat-containing protein [Posidoniimonas polymericola]TWT72840.1 ASPIC and UnbV [Posidoniimonas polymericola]